MQMFITTVKGSLHAAIINPTVTQCELFVCVRFVHFEINSGIDTRKFPDKRLKAVVVSFSSERRNRYFGIVSIHARNTPPSGDFCAM